MTYPAPFTGNATGDAEIRTSQSGITVATFTLAVTPREKQPDGTYGDGPTAYYRVSAFRQLADNVAESVKRGDRVTVVGTLKPRPYEHQGQERLSLDVLADDVALSLRFATAQAVKVSAQPRQPQQPAWGGQQPQQGNPWSTGGGGMPAGTGPHDEPPFAK